MKCLRLRHRFTVPLLSALRLACTKSKSAAAPMPLLEKSKSASFDFDSETAASPLTSPSTSSSMSDVAWMPFSSCFSRKPPPTGISCS